MPAEQSTPDVVLAALTDLEARLRRDLAGLAAVERNTVAGHPVWAVHPQRPRALPVSWMAGSDELFLWAGAQHRGGAWELDPSVEDAEFVEAVVRAVAAGRVTETSALARSRVDVVLHDGRRVQQTGFAGCFPGLLPLPGWRRWGRVTRYEPYS